ncbi:MAG: hypothetical protein OEM15_12405 [Myxococcales bacterium]|nr:hypothetical protein [Myxococcales bacterium]MDH3484775.1 hypothetical protein [Myxococcales bacterium]
MRIVLHTFAVLAALSIHLPIVSAQSDVFVTLTKGGLLMAGGQPVVVTREPRPAAVVLEAPPAPEASVIDPPEAPLTGAIWVPGHWTHGTEGFVWVNGRFIAPKPGHAFVPPRWVFFAGHHLFFRGFFVPHRVFVRSFFNTFHFSGDPTRRESSANRNRGPYWPIGVSRPIVGTPSKKGRGPYWPLGLGPPTVLNTRGGTPVGLRPGTAVR